MTNDTNSSIKLSDGVKTIEISGSKSFVSLKFDELFSRFFESNLLNTNGNNRDNLCEKETSNKYITAGIYSIDNETNIISIHKRIPGNTKSEKTKNIALITLFALNQAIPAGEIKKSCEQQKCLDTKNFAAIFKRDIENFIIKGKGQKWTLELSIPGKENAKSLLDSMVGNE